MRAKLERGALAGLWARQPIQHEVGVLMRDLATKELEEGGGEKFMLRTTYSAGEVERFTFSFICDTREFSSSARTNPGRVHPLRQTCCGAYGTALPAVGDEVDEVIREFVKREGSNSHWFCS